MTTPGPAEVGGVEEQALRAQVKEQIRRRMRAVRDVLPPEARRARSEAIAARVTDLAEIEAARVVSAFVAIKSEVDPAPIVAALRARGARIALPRVDVETGRIVLHDHAEAGPLEPGAYGVPEPPSSAPEVDPADVDVVLVPALAADPRGHRIGYGKGYYDRLLPTLTSAVRCCLIYDFQLVAEVPDVPGDEPVQLVVTDTQTLRVHPAA